MKGKDLSTSFSGDSTSFSPICMSLLILCDKGWRFGGKGHLESLVRGASLHFESFHVGLEQPAGVGHRLEQPGVMTHF